MHVYLNKNGTQRRELGEARDLFYSIQNRGTLCETWGSQAGKFFYFFVLNEEGTDFVRNVGNLSFRDSVLSQKTWIHSDSSVVMVFTLNIYFSFFAFSTFGWSILITFSHKPLSFLSLLSSLSS